MSSPCGQLQVLARCSQRLQRDLIFEMCRQEMEFTSGQITTAHEAVGRWFDSIRGRQSHQGFLANTTRQSAVFYVLMRATQAGERNGLEEHPNG